MIMTPNGILIPIIIKNGLSYIKHYCPTEKQMQYIKREEFMTSKNDWDPSIYDDPKCTADLRLQQFPPTPIDATNSFYYVEGNI